MHLSVLTSKGQTTIPKKVRETLDLKPDDKIIYIPDGKRVFITTVRGNILDIKGSVKQQMKNPMDFKKLRKKVKKEVSKKVMEKIK